MVEMQERIDGTFADARNQWKRSFGFGLLFGLALGILFFIEEKDELGTRVIGALMMVPATAIAWTAVFVPFFYLLNFVKRRFLVHATILVDSGSLIVRRSGRKGASNDVVHCPVADVIDYSIAALDARGYELGRSLSLRYLDSGRIERKFVLPLAYFPDGEVAALEAFLAESVPTPGVGGKAPIPC